MSAGSGDDVHEDTQAYARRNHGVPFTGSSKCWRNSTRNDYNIYPLFLLANHKVCF